MRIAIVGTGIAGMTAAYYLKEYADLVIYEKDSRIGGHTATVDVEVDGIKYAVDTGFIVYNEKTYPNFIRMMDELGVQTQETTMGFSVSCQKTGLEYAGSNLGTFFAQKSRIFSVAHWRMLRDIMRFNKEAPRHLAENRVDPNITLADYLDRFNYSKEFRQHYLIPMGAAIWSASSEVMANFPMQFFIRFFRNHGLLQVKNRPQWRVIKGGSRNYIGDLTREYRKNIRFNQDIVSIERSSGKVIITNNEGESETFDEVIFACHSDQALNLLDTNATPLEVEILGAIPYQDNEVVLHTDESMLPNNRSTWSSWNYHLKSARQEAATLTYNMNILQGIKAPVTFCVTLNDTASIDPKKILARFYYAHPEFSLAGIAAQKRWQEINGVTNSWFCGAYWRNGFHEDGVFSALNVVNGILQKYRRPTIKVLDYD